MGDIARALILPLLLIVLNVGAAITTDVDTDDLTETDHIRHNESATVAIESDANPAALKGGDVRALCRLAKRISPEKNLVPSCNTCICNQRAHITYLIVVQDQDRQVGERGQPRHVIYLVTAQTQYRQAGERGQRRHANYLVAEQIKGRQVGEHGQPRQVTYLIALQVKGHQAGEHGQRRHVSNLVNAQLQGRQAGGGFETTEVDDVPINTRERRQGDEIGSQDVAGGLGDGDADAGLKVGVWEHDDRSFLRV